MKKVKEYLGVTMFFMGLDLMGLEPSTPDVPGWQMTLVVIGGFFLMVIGGAISGAFEKNEEDE